MIATIALALTLASPAASPPMPAPCASSMSSERLQGRWAGDFAQSTWTFELVREGDTWAGRYMTSRTEKWIPLHDVAVSGGCANFSLKSTPKVIFRLALGVDDKTLAGDLQIDGRVTLPFSATRTS